MQNLLATVLIIVALFVGFFVGSMYGVSNKTACIVEQSETGVTEDVAEVANPFNDDSYKNPFESSFNPFDTSNQ